MSSVALYTPPVTSTEAGPGGRLHAAFLAGRSPHTLRAYRGDLLGLLRHAVRLAHSGWSEQEFLKLTPDMMTM